MTDLCCPNCEPRSPVHDDEYYAVERIQLLNRDGVVDADEGYVRFHDHSNVLSTVYVVCADCGEVLVDNREEAIEKIRNCGEYV